MNETIAKFGYPETLVAEFAHWLVLLRPSQPTFCSLVLAAKSDASAFGDLPKGAHAELKTATVAIERALAAKAGYAKLNYLMLMMVDPHVHFHVVPRYEGVREWQGVSFADAGWPGPPQLSPAIALTPDQIANMVAELRAVWP